MGRCRYCGDNAGFLRQRHTRCHDDYGAAVAQIDHLTRHAAMRSEPLDGLVESVRRAAAMGRVPMGSDQLQETLAQAWQRSVEAAVEDRILSSNERRNLNRFRVYFRLGEDLLDRRGHFRLFRMFNLLNVIEEEGRVPRFDRRAARARFGRLPFNLMKSEELVWVFDDVPYIEEISEKQFQGGSLGMSFRVAKGVYVRPGAFRGKTVTSRSMQETDHGMMGITTKHIYFGGGQKAFRVRLDRIVAITPYADALGIMRDRASARPEAFRLDGNDAWFAANLIEAVQAADALTLPGSDDPTLDEIVESDVTDDLTDLIDDEDDDDDAEIVPIPFIDSS